MKIKITIKERDSKIQLLDDNGKELFRQINTYDELGSSGVEATEDLAREFGMALRVPVETDETFEEL